MNMMFGRAMWEPLYVREGYDYVSIVSETHTLPIRPENLPNSKINPDQWSDCAWQTTYMIEFPWNYTDKLIKIIVSM